MAGQGLDDQMIEVQLERIPGRRIPLGLEWQDAPVHGCKAGWLWRAMKWVTCLYCAVFMQVLGHFVGFMWVYWV